jgi:hypothetical protein
MQDRIARLRPGSIPNDRVHPGEPAGQESPEAWRPVSAQGTGVHLQRRVEAPSATATDMLRRSFAGGAAHADGREGSLPSQPLSPVIRRHLFYRKGDPIDVDDDFDPDEDDAALDVDDVLGDSAFKGVSATALTAYREELLSRFGEDEKHLSFAGHAALLAWLQENVEVEEADADEKESSESDSSEDEKPQARSGRGGPRGEKKSGRQMTVGKVKMSNEELHLGVKADVKAKLGKRGIARLLKIKDAKNFDMRIENDGTILIGDNNTGGKAGVDSGLVLRDGKVVWREGEEQDEDEDEPKEKKGRGKQKDRK